MPSEAERDRAEAFLTAFNAIETELKRLTGVQDFEGFRDAAHRYKEMRPGWQDYNAVLAFADVRNIVVHRRYKPFQYISVPSEESVSDIERIRERLLKPRTARDEFKHNAIVVLQSSDPLTALLEHVRASDFTYFPVYDGESFAGLVTSNGVTRWLARAVTGISIIEFGDHHIRDVLSLEEERANVQFVPAHMPVEDVVYGFQVNVHLEAALVTHNGRSSESLLGIATRWDIADLLPQG